MRDTENSYDEFETEDQPLGLKDSFIKEISELLDKKDNDRVLELCRELSAEDTAELIVKLNRADRNLLLKVLGDEIDPETFACLDEEILNSLLEHIPPAHIASIINELESDDAIHLIEDLDDDLRHQVMRHINKKLRGVVEEGLNYPEESAGRLMQREVVSVPQFWTVGKTVDYMRAAASDLPERFYNVFVVDPMHHVTGMVHLSDLLSAQRSDKIESIASEDLVIIPVDMDETDVAFLFRRQDLLSAPVVDENSQLVGVITVDDVVDVIHEDAEKEVLHLSGVNDTDIHRQAISTANSRFTWLGINLLTAIAASLVVGIFEGTIAKLATLAVLMPIVASMGGNAGTQTLAVTVRALATRDLTSANTWRVIIKECLVGMINGVLFAIIIGTAVYLWFGDMGLGSVIASAMIVNLFLAGLSGAIIPIVMSRMGFDPAQSAVVFLTTVTDVAGFFSFLGLASMFLIK